MSSELTSNARTVLDLIDKHQLPVCWFGVGLAGPDNIDVDVIRWADLEPWAEVLGAPSTVTDTGHGVLRAEFEGLRVRVGSRQKPEAQ